MASVIAGIFFVIVALACGGLTFLDILANSQARATGGDVGGLSPWPPLLGLASAGLAVWLFVSP